MCRHWVKNFSSSNEMAEFDRHYPCVASHEFNQFLKLMKISIVFALLLSLFLLAPITPTAHAQHRQRIHLRKRTNSLMMNDSTTSNGVPISSAGTEVSGVTGSAPGDPYNIAHPFFNGNSRWSDADTMYKHGDFPWALVSQHPNDFQFDAASGKWQVINSADLQKSR